MTHSDHVLFDEPGPAALARHRRLSLIFYLVVAAIAAWVGKTLWADGQLAPEMWKPFLTEDMWTTFLLPGIRGTLVAAAISIVAAVTLGIILGACRQSTSWVIRKASGAIVDFFRAVPMLVLMIFFFALYAGQALFPVDYLAPAAVISGLTLCNAAVIAELVRSGIRALPRGQTEAAEALGLQPGHTMRRVLLPQAISSMLPPMIAQMVVILKDTALGYQITYIEVVRQGVQAGSTYSNYIPALVVVAAFMVIVNFGLGRLAVAVERRVRSGRRRSVPAAAGTKVPALSQL